MSRKKRVKKLREHLAHFHIAGFTYYEGAKALKELEVGDELEIEIDEENKYDPRAVSIYFKDFKLGFIPRDENRIFYKLLRVNSENIQVTVQQIDKSREPEFQVKVVAHLVPAK